MGTVPFKMKKTTQSKLNRKHVKDNMFMSIGLLLTEVKRLYNMLVWTGPEKIKIWVKQG